MYKQPVLIAGAGVRGQYDVKAFRDLIEYLNIPVLLTWGGMDLLPYDHPLNCGGLGVVGPKAGNWAVQNADLIVTHGTELNYMITGSDRSLFAPKAKFIEVKDFQKANVEDNPGWLIKIKTIKAEPRPDHGWNVCPYKFMDALSDAMKPGDILVTDAGANLCQTMQAFKVKEGQRVFSAWNHSPMGYSLPAAIGASLANPTANVVCIIGDGGLMMCLQELATARRHNLPIKIFLFNNQGHGIQKQTMRRWLDGRYHGADEETGLWFPRYHLLSHAFAINYSNIPTNDFYEIEDVLATNLPEFVEVMIDKNSEIRPFLRAGQRLEEI